MKVRIHCSCGAISNLIDEDLAKEYMKNATYPDHRWKLEALDL